MLITMTAVCLILAAISWAGIREAVHLVGAVLIVLFCAATIVVIELCRQRWPDRSLSTRYLVNSPLNSFRVKPLSPFLTESPFRSENPFRDEALDVDASQPSGEKADEADNPSA